MRQITIADIHTRLKGFKTTNSNDRFLSEATRSITNSSRLTDVTRHLESLCKSNNDVQFYTYMQLFESIVSKGNTSDIKKYGNYIAENAIPKVRDSKATNTLIKRRLTVLQHKTTSPISKSIEDAIGALKIDNTAGADISNFSNKSDSKDQAVEEAYTRMLEECEIMSNCDRVIENYNRISKRFNLDKLFIENTRYNGVGDTVVSLCNKIDTYDMPTSVKFNTVIETAWYGFESNSIDYSKSEILENAVDYFAFKTDGLEVCKNILESTLFYDKNDDMKNIDILMEEEPEEEETSVSESIMNTFANNPSINNISEASFNDIFNKFKKEELKDKPESKIKSLVSKLYSRDVESIVNDTPDLLRWIRKFFILGSCAIPVIGPVLMAVTYIADRFISIHQDREDLPKMIKCFNNEIKASKTKLSTTEDDEEKEKLNKYIKSLETARDKLENYYSNFLSEKEQEKRYEEMDMDDYDFDDFDFDDFDDDFLENTITSEVRDIYSIFNSKVINETSLYNLIGKITGEDLINIAHIVNKYPDDLHKDIVESAIKDNIESIRITSESKSILTDSIKLSSLNSALAILESNENYETPLYTIYDAKNEIDIMYEAYSAISIMMDTYNNQNSLLEASFTNTLKVASMKLRNAFRKMSDKEKAVSKNLDVGMNNLKKGIERAVTNDNREAIIKGSVLPSFSKLVKLCIVNAGLVIFGKEIGLITAIIGTLGYFGTNAKFKAKERQMVIDEIEIELEMCEKYIAIAEQKNDMKALKQLLTTKKELQRQHQRIKYKMKVDFGQKYYDSNSAGGND